MKYLLCFLCAILLTISVQAQVKKKIKKGRRYKSESQFALKKNDLQVEWEFGRETIDSQLTTVVYPNLELHYAVTDRLEVNTEMSLISIKDHSYLAKKNTTGIEPVLIGVNYQLLRDTYNSPSVILSGQLAIPQLSSKAFTINYLAPVIQVDIQEALHQWIFGVSSGLQWDGYSTSPGYTFNVNTSYTFKKKWMVTAECFGFINHSQPQNSIDASLAYVVNDLVQFGITAGAGISAAASNNYFAVNGTWGFHHPAKLPVH